YKNSCSLKLFVETRRYNNIPHGQRLCKMCNMSMVQDEYHFLLICPEYRTIKN
ncbi:hypothetical protein ScPMuIL_000051, partial [Solemya velum]